MNNLHKWAGTAALLQAALYIAAFIFFGAFWEFPSKGNSAEKLAYLSSQRTTLYLLHLLLYVFFAVLLSVLVLSIHEHLKNAAGKLAKLATLFGYIWVALLIASGMIANIGLLAVVDLSTTEPEQARAVWLAVDVVVEGIGGGNELVGGLWVLLLSFAALKSKVFSTQLNFLGLFVGIAGICTIYPAELFTEIFGLSQIIWFIGIGCTLLKDQDNTQLV